MIINLVEICRLKYPGQVEALNITFRQPENEVLFASWNVAGVLQPKESDIMAEAAYYQPIYDMNCLKEVGNQIIDLLLESTAQSRQYLNAISCTTYSSSSNAIWKAESLAFIAWRDSVYEYAIQVFNDVETGTIPAPTPDEFKTGIPQMVWPN